MPLAQQQQRMLTPWHMNSPRPVSGSEAPVALLIQLAQLLFVGVLQADLPNKIKNRKSIVGGPLHYHSPQLYLAYVWGEWKDALL